MKLAIFGSTGKTGLQVVQQALAQGHSVTAFVRSPDKIREKNEKLQVIKGDVLDFSSVERAVQGQDAVICTLGLPPLDKSKLRAKGTRNIIKAAEKHNVKRFICQSSHGVGESRDILPPLYKYFIVPFILRNVFADHDLQESEIKKSNLEWIIVRPVALTDGSHTGTYQYFYTADTKKVTNKISRADTADFILKQLDESIYLHKTPSISY